MTVADIKDKLGLSCIAGSGGLSKEVKTGYTGDLLSMVMADIPEESAWVTVLNHINVIAVAVLCQASCVIVAENVKMTQEALDKAETENIPIFTTALSAYETARKLIGIGL